MSTLGGEDLRRQPALESKDAEFIARKHFGIVGTARELPSERDQNFQIEASCGQYVLKIANPDTDLAFLELENHAIRLAEAVNGFNSPSLMKSLDGQTLIRLDGGNDEIWMVRCLGFVPGIPLARFSAPSSKLLRAIGAALAELDQVFHTLNQNPAARRNFKWDLTFAPKIVQDFLTNFTESEKTSILLGVLDCYGEIESRLADLPESVIHNDPNDHNILIDEQGDQATPGLIDFGDMVYSKTINNLAICLAYAVLDKQDPVAVACEVISGYHRVRRLSESELSVLFPLMCLRLAQSVCIAAEQKRLRPDNEYLTVTEASAWSTLRRLLAFGPVRARLRFSDASHAAIQSARDESGEGTVDAFGTQHIIALRKKTLGPSLSLAYQRPLHFVRGKGQYLFDVSDLTYLDCVNNVCHVGHCHPKVVEAAVHQIGRLNTNTRYLHENIVRLAEKLTSKLPEPLEVCYFVNSGSEANDLALRMARTYTGNTDVVVLDHAYHGHTSALIDISPYKFNRIGGAGQPEHVHVLPLPDGYRGPFKNDDPDCGIHYAAAARKVVEAAVGRGRRIAAFFAESLPGCAGQIPLPENYLPEIYCLMRENGAICVADEVQVGFGRVGTHFWGFEQQNVAPDIVTMGKPMGNGHPLAAVVTTRAIADAFHNGMEYFNTFGGNPVSCAIGMAVLDVIEKEELQLNAKELGDWLIRHLRRLAEKHSIIGDVRGSGMFLGIELVTDRLTLKPAAEEANLIVNKMRDQFILLSTDGPHENVIKFKPPLVFSKADAERVVMVLDQVLSRHSQS